MRPEARPGTVPIHTAQKYYYYNDEPVVAVVVVVAARREFRASGACPRVYGKKARRKPDRVVTRHDNNCYCNEPAAVFIRNYIGPPSRRSRSSRACVSSAAPRREKTPTAAGAKTIIVSTLLLLSYLYNTTIRDNNDGDIT